MTDIVQVGLSALIAQQRAIAVASNNIANANTPGYSRQRIELSTRATERLGNAFVGTGVVAGATARINDELIADQLRTASAGFSRTATFVGFAESLDNLLADEQTGLNVTLQALANAVQDVANDPSSIAARQVLLGEARNLVVRFDSMDRRLAELGVEATSRLTATTTEINALGAGIAEINRQIISSGVAPDRPPPSDLLDQRDRLLERLAEVVKVNVTNQADGTLSVFIGSGQVLVLGTSATTLAVIPGTLDPAEPQIVLQGPTGNVNVTQFLTGGELGGVLDFNREMLAPARAELGRIAVGIVDAFNAMHRTGMDWNGNLGGDFFAVGEPQVFDAMANTGGASVTASIVDVGALEAASYRLSYDGANYTLLRADTLAVIPTAGTGTALDPLVAEGFEIVIAGAPAAGDQFLIQPVSQAAGQLRLLIDDPALVAAAAPIRTRAELLNRGSATVSVGEVVDATDPGLLTTATIEFAGPNTFSVNGAGAFAYVPGSDIVINGSRITITGVPEIGDRFVIERNAGGIGDNRNALRIIDALRGGVLQGGAFTLQAAVGRLITDVGAKTAESQSRRDAQGLLINQTRQRLDSIRGVSLDEEAADLLRFEQLYQAAAQVMSVADDLFNSLLIALRR